jgi:hypothetical protein
MEGVREPLRTGALLGVHNTCGSRVRFCCSLRGCDPV